ncbi:Nudix (Nucleoside diphosphate linked moiety X)-type motif 1 [Entomophthora muscae]|uniref:Nudix (Nucleoside diphosphate linked moiety X)-type motif 1 n=1 Tax=Entomophthora muscae TaxID=34485 RepID=A0ACC2TQP4_9FUNG|nr:Nudix (Nucleoside diphosphate linked moiety X)-type motif 1 [Entomophthora muscae]
MAMTFPDFDLVCNQEIESRKLYTNLFLISGSKILLGLKKRGLGQGKWNGFGGKVESEETIEEGAIREMKEEAGIDVDLVEKIGILEFVFSGRPQALETHIFVAKGYSGELIESEEMYPQWFPWSMDAIPFDTMWSDDHLWFPYLQQNQKFKGKFYIDGNDEATILGATLNPVESL